MDDNFHLEQAGTGEAAGTAPARILIVEDERSVRAVLQRVLGRYTYQVDCVENAEVALERIRAAPPDLLIVDKNLPGMNGVELIRAVRAENENIWSIMITAFPSASSAIDTLHLGVYAYLEKPFDDIFRVADRIEEVISLKRKCDRVRKSTERLRALRVQEPAHRPKVIVTSPVSVDRDWMVERLADRVEVVGVSSPQELIQLIHSASPHLVILDEAFEEVDLPRRVGEIREVAPEVRCAVVCEGPSINLITRLIDAGVKAVLERPLEEEGFFRRLDGVLREIRLKVLELPEGRA